jgi:uncharacterized membrane protein
MYHFKRSDMIAVSLLLVFVIAFSYLNIQKHNAFNTHALDLAKFDQAIWNTGQGRPFTITLGEELVIQSHFSPSFALLAPLYWIWSDVRLLFIMQALLTVGAGLFIYAFFRPTNPTLGLIVYTAYLMQPSLHQVSLLYFRRLTLAIFFSSFMIYHLLRKRYGWMLLGLLITLFSKEDMAFICIGVGLYLLVLHRSLKLGLFLSLLGIAYLFLVPFFVLPALNASTGYHHAAANFDYLGDSIDEIVPSLAQNPTILFDYPLRPERLSALFLFFWPTLFLFLLAPELAAFLLPYLAFLLASTSDEMGQLRLWYPSVLLVFLYWAVALGTYRLPQKQQKIALGGLLVAGLTSWLLYSQLWPGANFEAARYQVGEHERQVRAALAEVPQEAIVAAQDVLVPHLAHREKIYLFPWLSSEEQADVIALDRDSKLYPLSPEQYQGEFYDLFAGTTYQITQQVDQFYLFQRLQRLEPQRLRQDSWDNAFTLTGYNVVMATKNGKYQISNREQTNNARINLFWRAEEEMASNYSIFIHLLDGQNEIITQHDGWPADAYRPTSALKAGETLRDVHYLSWIEAIPHHELSLRIGVYESQTGDSLLLPDGQPFIVVPFAE